MKTVVLALAVALAACEGGTTIVGAEPGEYPLAGEWEAALVDSTFSGAGSLVSVDSLRVRLTMSVHGTTEAATLVGCVAIKQHQDYGVWLVSALSGTRTADDIAIEGTARSWEFAGTFMDLTIEGESTSDLWTGAEPTRFDRVGDPEDWPTCPYW